AHPRRVPRHRLRCARARITPTPHRVQNHPHMRPPILDPQSHTHTLLSERSETKRRRDEVPHRCRASTSPRLRVRANPPPAFPSSPLRLFASSSLPYHTTSPNPIHTPAITITTAVYPTMSRAFTPVIAKSGSAQNG